MIEQREMQAYIDTLTEATLNGTIRYVIPGAVRARVVWHILLDVTYHATQHRSEAAVLLTGYRPVAGRISTHPVQHERAQGSC